MNWVISYTIGAIVVHVALGCWSLTALAVLLGTEVIGALVCAWVLAKSIDAIRRFDNQDEGGLS